MKTYNFASIDVGSNSINLLLAYVHEKKIVFEKNHSFITGLGKGVRDSFRFTQEGMEKSYSAFSKIRNLVDQNHIQNSNVVCVATEASRVAKNSLDFYKKINRDFSLKAKIISAEQESKLSVLGAVSKNVQETLLMDMGGASTEISHYKLGRIINFQSFKIGAVCKSDNFSNKDLKKFVEQLDFNATVLLVGGTASTMAMAMIGGSEFAPESINKYSTHLEEINIFKEKIISMSDSVLLESFPILESRLDSIRCGVLSTHEILELINPTTIYFSTKGLRHGALLEFIG